MSVELLQRLSLISYIVAGVLFLIALALFFLLDIKKVIGDVTGITARKAINTIREQNEASGNKVYKPSPVNAARGKLTDKITASGKLQPKTSGLGGSLTTEKFDTSKLMPLVEETTVLDEQGSDTTVLEQISGAKETTVLSYDINNKTENNKSDKNAEKINFSTDVELGFAESDEIIE